MPFEKAPPKPENIPEVRIAPWILGPHDGPNKPVKKIVASVDEDAIVVQDSRYVDVRNNSVATRTRIEANIAESRVARGSSGFADFIKTEGRLQESLDIWPPNMGRLGPVEKIELQPGFVMDRFGLPHGRFLSPQNVPFSNRALPSSYEANIPYFMYEVVKPIPNVTKNRVLPWFGQKGLGEQLELPKTNINYLDPCNGYVKVRHREQ